MSTATLPETAASPDVRMFLKQHNAEAAFVTLCELVRECYPALRRIDVELSADPDEDDRWKVLLWVRLPAMALETYLAQHDTYHERLRDEISVPQLPLFGVLTQ